MKHAQDTGRSAVHPFAFIGTTDPSLDPDNDCGPGKAWVDTTTGRLKLRNDDDDAWVLVGGEDA